MYMFLFSKLNIANALLSKLRNFVTSEILRSVYLAIFHSHVNYTCKAWGLTSYSQHKVSILHKKALKLINFALFNAHTPPLFKRCRPVAAYIT